MTARPDHMPRLGTTRPLPIAAVGSCRSARGENSNRPPGSRLVPISHRLQRGPQGFRDGLDTAKGAATGRHSPTTEGNNAMTALGRWFRNLTRDRVQYSALVALRWLRRRLDAIEARVASVTRADKTNGEEDAR